MPRPTPNRQPLTPPAPFLLEPVLDGYRRQLDACTGPAPRPKPAALDGQAKPQPRAVFSPTTGKVLSL